MDLHIPLACVSTLCFLDPFPGFFDAGAVFNFKYFTSEEICFFGAKNNDISISSLGNFSQGCGSAFLV